MPFLAESNVMVKDFGSKIGIQSILDINDND